MAKKSDNGYQLAFPVSGRERPEDYLHRGLTKREHIAALAMQALISTINSNESVDEELTAQVSKESVLYADALLAQLDQPPAE